MTKTTLEEKTNELYDDLMDCLFEPTRNLCGLNFKKALLSLFASELKAEKKRWIEKVRIEKKNTSCLKLLREIRKMVKELHRQIFIPPELRTYLGGHEEE